MWTKISNLLKTMLARLTFRGEPSLKRWVFSSVHNKTFNYNSRYLFLYVRDHCPEIHPYFVINDEKLRRELGEKYGQEYFIESTTFKGIRQILSSKVWFTSTAPPLYGIGFRKKYVIINLWHGVPLKKIGMEQENLSTVTRTYYKYLFADNYEAVLTTSHNMIPVMSRSFMVEPERIRVWGQPRNDMMFHRQDSREVLQRLYGKTDEKDEVLPVYRKVILYAPTFRDHEPTKLFPFPEFAHSGSYGLQALLDFLEEHQLLICIRLHLYDHTGYGWLKKLDSDGNRIRFLNEDRADDIMEVLNIFDLLITDYSSIYIDFLLTGRPVLFLPYDSEEYLKNRGMNFDYDLVTPGPKPKTFKEFLNSVYVLLYNHDSYGQQRDEVNQFFNEIREPCCAKICEEVKSLIGRYR